MAAIEHASDGPATGAAIERLIASITSTPEGKLLIVEQVRSADLVEQRNWGAIYSADEMRAYRYALWRVWDEAKPILAVCMLNPSTADHLANDNTIMQVMRRAASLGYGGIVVVNAFAFRATDPAQMKKQHDPVGPLNNQTIRVVLEGSVHVLCAWGDHVDHANRGKEVECLIKDSGAKAFALRVSKKGRPCHPLRIGYHVQPKPFALTCDLHGTIEQPQ